MMLVAPYVGAWIETSLTTTTITTASVAPYVGAWIETDFSHIYMFVGLSHPTWVRGLKLLDSVRLLKAETVAPYVGAWIETSLAESIINQRGRTLRGCVD